MLKRCIQGLALIVLALAPIEAAAQSTFGNDLAIGLLNACRTAHFHDVVFIGRPLVAGGPESRLITVEVETAFRGVDAKTMLVSSLGSRTLDARQSYLMYGHRAPGGSVVELQDFQAATDRRAQQAIQLFTAAMPQSGYVTVMGVAEVGHHPDRPPFLPLTGLRIRLHSDEYAKDLFTGKSGQFTASGIPPGRIELTPLLPDALKVFDVKGLAYTAGADECVLLSFFVVSSGRSFGVATAK